MMHNIRISYLNPSIPVIGCTAVGIRSKTIEIKIMICELTTNFSYYLYDYTTIYKYCFFLEKLQVSLRSLESRRPKISFCYFYRSP